MHDTILNCLFFRRPLLISSCIYPEDERSETVCQAILDDLKEKATRLDGWIAMHEKRFGQNHDIPSSASIDISKLNGGGMINTDTCNGARKLSELLADAVNDAVRQKLQSRGEVDTEDNITSIRQDCHHHMRNVWIGAVTKRLSAYLNNLLSDDLSNIEFRLRVTTMFDGILRAIDKEFSLPANYPKGHGDMFKHWLRMYHPEALLVPVERTAGSRQDLACEGAAAVYWNRRLVSVSKQSIIASILLIHFDNLRYYVEWLDECLRTVKDNILQENLFIVLTSVEMIALCRVMAILHYKICMPLRWLAGNTHFLGQTGYDWSARSMGKAIDSLERALEHIELDGKLYLDEDFMNEIFDDIYVDDDGNAAPLAPLKDAMGYTMEEKQSERLDGSKVLSFDLLNAELFYPERDENKATTALVEAMAREVAECMLTELRDTSKATSDYVSSIGGKFS